MNTRIIIIKNCNECPYFSWNPARGCFCGKRPLKDDRGIKPGKSKIPTVPIPDWCPLEKKQEK